MQRLEEPARFLTDKKEQTLIRAASVVIHIARGQLRSKVIGNPTPIVQTDFLEKSGSAKVASQ